MLVRLQLSGLYSQACALIWRRALSITEFGTTAEQAAVQREAILLRVSEDDDIRAQIGHGLHIFHLHLLAPGNISGC